MGVITGLLNDSTKDLSNKKVSILPLEEIHPNKLNQAPITNIAMLVESIKENGLCSPLLVYKEENHCYIIINGERRYTALKKLAIANVAVIIVEKPLSILDERLLILDANAQRNEGKEYKRMRAIEYGELYQLSKDKGNIPSGTLRINWIGMHMNLSGRQVQRILKEENQEHGHDVHVKKSTLPEITKKMNKLVESIEKIDFTEYDDLEISKLKEMISCSLDSLRDILSSLIS